MPVYLVLHQAFTGRSPTMLGELRADTRIEALEQARETWKLEHPVSTIKVRRKVRIAKYKALAALPPRTASRPLPNVVMHVYHITYQPFTRDPLIELGVIEAVAKRRALDLARRRWGRNRTKPGIKAKRIS